MIKSLPLMRSAGIVAIAYFFFLATQSVEAQSSHPVICGNQILEDKLSLYYPEWKENIDLTFRQASQLTPQRTNEPLTIQVVVHVIWKEIEENLDDSIIYDQLRILNEDFNRMNADTGNLREVFQPVAGNANIHFEIAEIIRVQTDKLFEVDLLGGTSILPEVKNTALGGSDPWDPNQYLNLWICKIQPLTILGFPVGQILGFSFPPNNLPHWPDNVGAPTPGEDGVLVDFRVVGSNNPNPIEDPVEGGLLDIRGRTPVHEVGHFLGLRHIWGDGGTFGPNDCDQSDGIEDTPYANAQSNFDCDLSKNSCQIVETYYGTDVPDMVENYMDYASETCMNAFTQGQVELMRNILFGPRNGLISPASSTTHAASMAFQISPNPAGDFIQLSSEIPFTENLHIQITGLDGRVWWTENTTAHDMRHNKKIDTPFLPEGLYVISVKQKNETYISKVSIIR